MLTWVEASIKLRKAVNKPRFTFEDAKQMVKRAMLDYCSYFEGNLLAKDDEFATDYIIGYYEENK